jgi:hypothetical protein
LNEHDEGAAQPHEIAHAGLRGAIAAMAMTGMRVLTVELGLVDQTPPQAIVKQRAGGLMRVVPRKRRRAAIDLARMVPRKRRRAAIELAHWSYGAVGGAAFALLPQGMRRTAWAGPAYGLAVWLGFELGLAPLLGLKQSKTPRPVDRAALAVDHLLYGFVLSETRRRPQE